MALGNLTRQLAAQAIGDKVNDLVDSLGSPEAARTDKTPAALADPIGAVMIGQIQAMQKALKEDQELVVLCSTGTEALRVLEIYNPSRDVLVVTGIDADRNVT